LILAYFLRNANLKFFPHLFSNHSHRLISIFFDYFLFIFTEIVKANDAFASPLSVAYSENNVYSIFKKAGNQPVWHNTDHYSYNNDRLLR